MVSEGERRVLILSRTPDVAGVGISLKTAFDHVDRGWRARLVTGGRHPFGYPVDIVARQRDVAAWRDVTRLYRHVDVVHILQDPLALRGLPQPHPAVVVWHLGSFYRAHPREVSAACRAAGALEVGGGVDVMFPPSMELLPIAADVAALEAIRRRVYRPSQRVRIAHAPSKRALKSTEAIEAAVARLATRYPIDFDLIEHVSWSECLERKAAADLFVDATTLGYGANAIECWAMGIPVVAGVDAVSRARLVAAYGSVPFVETSEATLEQDLEPLVASAQARRLWGRRGAAHVRVFHSEEAVVDRAIELYVLAGARAR